jgi:hypothetical protein
VTRAVHATVTAVVVGVALGVTVAVCAGGALLWAVS